MTEPGNSRVNNWLTPARCLRAHRSQGGEGWQWDCCHNTGPLQSHPVPVAAVWPCRSWGSVEVLAGSSPPAGEAQGHSTGPEGVTASSNSPEFLCCLRGEVRGTGEELGSAAAARAGTFQKSAIIPLPLSLPPSPPALPAVSPLQLPPPHLSLFSHNELMLIAPWALSAAGVEALVRELPS